MNITRTTEPATETITLTEAKSHLRIVDDTDDDTYITTLISVARRAIEDMTGRTLIDTVFQQTARNWRPWISLARGQAHTISSITYTDTAVATQTVDPADYSIAPFGDGLAQVAFAGDFAEPELYDHPVIDRIQIHFTAGYGATAATVPEPLRQAVLYLLAHYYENRSPVGINVNATKLPFAVESLAAPYKIYN